MLRHSWIPAVAFLCARLYCMSPPWYWYLNTHTHTPIQSQIRETPTHLLSNETRRCVQSTLFAPQSSLYFVFPNKASVIFPLCMWITGSTPNRLLHTCVKYTVYCISSQEQSRTTGQLGFLQCYRSIWVVPGVPVSKWKMAKLVVA